MSATKQFRCAVLLWITVILLPALTGCHSAHSTQESDALPAAASSKANGLPDLRHSIELLGDTVKKPAFSFHLSFRKNRSDGSSFQYEADISPGGITGRSTLGTFTQNWNGTPMGSSEWRGVAMAVLQPLPYDQLEEAQPGVKYAADESTGGYDAHRYDFDLGSVPASAKAGVLMGTNAVGSIVGSGRKLKDYNVKGSAWIAKDDGHLVKTIYDYITVFDGGERDTTHYEVVATKK